MSWGGKGGMEQPSDNLYITGLPDGIDDMTVRQIFGGYGVVTQARVMAGKPGAPDCVALIRFQTVQEAATVKEMLNGNIPQGLSQPIAIKYKAGGDQSGGPQLGKAKSRPDWEPMSDNLYVMGLPLDVDDATIRQVFGVYGTITSTRVLPPRPGADDKVALIRYTSVQEAASIKETLNGTVPQGLLRPVTIKFKAGPQGEGAQAAVNHNDDTPSETLYVKGLPLGIDENTLMQIFQSYGQLASCKVLPTMEGAADSAVLLRFGAVEVAKWVKDNLDGNIPQGLESPVYVKYKAPANKGGNKGGSKGFGGQDMGGFGGAEEVSDNLFVTGLPVEVDEPSVKQIFQLYGTVVQCKVLPARGSDCAALIRYQTATEAQWVKENLDGNIPQGMQSPVGIKYKNNGGGKGGQGSAPADAGWGAAPTGGKGGGWDQSSPYGGGKGGQGFAGAGAAKVGATIAKGFEESGGLPEGSGIGVSDAGTVYVAGLPADMEEIDIYRIFAPFGALKPKGIKILTNPDGTCKGIAFVNFIDEACAQNAISVCDQAQMPDGTFLRVSVKQQTGGKGGGKAAPDGGAAAWGGGQGW